MKEAYDGFEMRWNWEMKFETGDILAVYTSLYSLNLTSRFVADWCLWRVLVRTRLIRSSNRVDRTKIVIATRKIKPRAMVRRKTTVDAGQGYPARRVTRGGSGRGSEHAGRGRCISASSSYVSAHVELSSPLRSSRIASHIRCLAR